MLYRCVLTKRGMPCCASFAWLNHPACAPVPTSPRSSVSPLSLISRPRRLLPLAHRSARLVWFGRGAACFHSVVFALALGAWSSSARADASVIVELKRADGSSADGIVRLSKGDAKHECTTKNGRCQIAAVPGGTYNVEVVQADKPAGKPKRVMIPPAGEVKLIVAAQ